MNFLAHIYLSGHNKHIQIGNFIGDFVKGKKYEEFPEDIKKGILLHRAIDDFTDKHKATKEATLPLKPVYGRYSGVVVDLLYDHILASKWDQYNPVSLKETVDQFHRNLTSHFHYLPEKVKRIVPIIIQNRRLESYSKTEGIKNALEIMAHRTTLPNHPGEAINILEKNRNLYIELTSQLMNDLISMISLQWKIDIMKP